MNDYLVFTEVELTYVYGNEIPVDARKKRFSSDYNKLPATFDPLLME